MNRDDALRPHLVDEPRRLGIFLVFTLALGAGAHGNVAQAVFVMGAALLAYAIVTGLHHLWHDRTRPTPGPLWWLLAIAWAISLALSLDGFRFNGFLVAFPMALGVALFHRHEMNGAPTLFLAGAAWVALHPGHRLQEAGFTEAAWIAIAMFLAVVAATLAHEVLLRRDGPGTPAVWTGMRLAFVSVWTLLVLQLREDIPWAEPFRLLGADLAGQAGQMFLVGVILVGLVLAAAALRPARPKGG